MLNTVRSKDGLLPNRITRPQRTGTKWTANPGSSTISFGAEGDSYFEYLIKAYYQSNFKDLEAKRLYDESIVGAKKHLVK